MFCECVCVWYEFHIDKLKIYDHILTFDVIGTSILPLQIDLNFIGTDMVLTSLYSSHFSLGDNILILTMADLEREMSPIMHHTVTNLHFMVENGDNRCVSAHLDQAGHALESLTESGQDRT